MKYEQFEQDVLSNGRFETLVKEFFDAVTESPAYVEALETLVDKTKALDGMRPDGDDIADEETQMWIIDAVEIMMAKQLASNFEAQQDQLVELRPCSVCTRFSVKDTCEKCQMELDQLGRTVIKCNDGMVEIDTKTDTKINNQ